MNKSKLVVILGPTATGKSHLAINLAKKINAEIISGDSMLIYQGMDIGTAKPSTQEQENIPHHLIDILPPQADFSVTQFKDLAENLILDINNRGKTPILVGGTGLYIRSLLEDYQFVNVAENTELRLELEKFALDFGKEALHKRLSELDSSAAEKLHYNDTRRVIRAIEVAMAGSAVSTKKNKHLRYQAEIFGLRMERQELYARINHRVLEMLAKGLVQEVQTLLANGTISTCQSMQGIGYKQTVDYLQGMVSLQQCTENIQQATRNFAKRQITWYRQMEYVNWLDITSGTDFEKLTDEILSKLGW